MASQLILKEPFGIGCTIEHQVSELLFSCSSSVTTAHGAMTPFQDIQIVNLLQFGKTLLLDNVIQSTQADEAIYHESLVHPVLLLANSPKSVFIGGGGELATAREVLKHHSVENITMVDIDREVIDASREFLPEWGGDTVYNDPRLHIYYEDAYTYLQKNEELYDLYDKIIIYGSVNICVIRGRYE